MFDFGFLPSASSFCVPLEKMSKNTTNYQYHQSRYPNSKSQKINTLDHYLQSNKAKLLQNRKKPVILSFQFGVIRGDLNCRGYWQEVGVALPKIKNLKKPNLILSK